MPLKKIDTWPEKKICRNPEHNPPGHICLEPGTYEHTCPGCGNVQKLIVPDYEMG